MKHSDLCNIFIPERNLPSAKACIRNKMTYGKNKIGVNCNPMQLCKNIHKKKTVMYSGNTWTAKQVAQTWRPPQGVLKTNRNDGLEEPGRSRWKWRSEPGRLHAASPALRMNPSGNQVLGASACVLLTFNFLKINLQGSLPAWPRALFFPAKDSISISAPHHLGKTE